MMEQLSGELATEGVQVQFVAINAVSAATPADQQKLIDRCSFPLFQDTKAVDAWGQHKAGKDDIFVYKADGTLSEFLPTTGGKNTDLSAADGYANLKQAVVDAQ